MADCYHCGLPIPAAADFPVEIERARREMCCAGCQAVAQAIVDQGGVPTLDVEKRETDSDSTRMLEQDLAGEELAISIYKDLIPKAESLGEYGIRQTLEGILMQEEEHRRDIMTSLGN